MRKDKRLYTTVTEEFYDEFRCTVGERNISRYLRAFAEWTLEQVKLNGPMALMMIENKHIQLDKEGLEDAAKGIERANGS